MSSNIETIEEHSLSVSSVSNIEGEKEDKEDKSDSEWNATFEQQTFSSPLLMKEGKELEKKKTNALTIKSHNTSMSKNTFTAATNLGAKMNSPPQF